jgi:hypothetical protein
MGKPNKSRMCKVCPKCGVAIKLEISGSSNVYGMHHSSHQQYGYDIAHGFCPNCNELIVLRRFGPYWQNNPNDEDSWELMPEREEVIFPHTKLKSVDPEVPERYKENFLEARDILARSPKASAAISRRLLQDILENHFKLKAHKLADEIDLFLKLPEIPSYLSQQIDAIRNIGNFAAHPLKDTSTGEVLDVEPGEAEWLLGTIDALFDFAFVQPKRMEELRKKLNLKLNMVGKPPMK